jgi:hypothetical protein
MRDNRVWIGLIALVGIIAPFSNAANATEAKFTMRTATVTQDAPKTASLVAKPRSMVMLKKYANAAALTDLDLVKLLQAVGFTGKGLRTAWAVAKSESNGQPIRYNGNRKTGDSSFGLFQINMISQLGPDRRERYNLKYNAELLNPVKNAQIVFKMTQGGTNWKAWKYAKTPAVKKWLKKFPAHLV